ncbi:MAG: Hemolysin activator protein precursor [Solimicrobium sp.]|jgi:hemolysin activation/secretion protein|nr:Hemolysin activator protein precursor [Solimicrobium sp.]
MIITRKNQATPVRVLLPLLSAIFSEVCALFFQSLITFSLLLPVSYSQVIQTPDQEEQRRRAQAEAQDRQRLFQEPKVNFTAEAVVENNSFNLPVDAHCFPLHQITLQSPSQLSELTKRIGASSLPLDRFFFAQNYLQNYVGKCVGQEGLNLMVRRLSNLILQKDYSTTRVGVAPQELSSGELALTFVPGMIHEIRFGDPTLYGTWRNALPTGAGQLLNLRELEQGLEQMKRVSNQEVEMQILPSDILGESDVVLTMQRGKAWKVSANFDNSGARGTGQLQAGGNFAIDNLFGLSDMFNIGVNTDANRKGEQRGTKAHSLYYAVPMGYWYGSLSASDYDYHQQIAGKNQSYNSSGKSQNLDLKINYVFHRDQTQKNSWQFNIGKRWSHAFIDDTEIDVQKRNVTYVEAGWIHKHYIGQAQLDLSLLNRWGASWFGGQRDGSSGATQDAFQAYHFIDEPTFHYTLQTIDATLYVPFSVGSKSVTYTGTLRGQRSKSPLYTSDQFSIGGRYTVRGFDGELTLTAERGFYLRNELNIPLDIPIANSMHSTYLGLDIGKVLGPSVKLLVGDTLAGATLGLRGTYKGASYDLFSSWPVYRPKQFKTTIPTLGFSLTFQY